MLPCAYKMIFGIDCPTCGAQRSFYLLLEGDFVSSFKMYPPLIPVLALIFIFIVHLFNKNIIGKKFLTKYSIFVLLAVSLSYIFKLLLKF
jgi:hypothetical protein